MTVDEFLTELYGDELSDMFIGNRVNREEPRAKLLPLMNTGIILAYAQWKLSPDNYSSEMLSVSQDTKEYTLAATDLLQVVQLINVYGLEVPSSQYQVLGQNIYFPDPETQELEVIYKVKHVKYTTAQDDTAITVAMPDMLIPWLKAYMCHRYFASMKTEAALVKAADFLNQMKMCEAVYVNTNTTGEFTAPTNTKLETRGFA